MHTTPDFQPGGEGMHRTQFSFCSSGGGHLLPYLTNDEGLNGRAEQQSNPKALLPSRYHCEDDALVIPGIQGVLNAELVTTNHRAWGLN